MTQSIKFKSVASSRWVNKENEKEQKWHQFLTTASKRRHGVGEERRPTVAAHGHVPGTREHVCTRADQRGQAGQAPAATQCAP